MGNAPRDPTAFIALMPGVQGSGSNAAGGLYGGQANSQEVYMEGMPLTNSAVQGDPNRYTESLSLRREFQIREGVRLAFQADAFNPLNWVVCAGPNINITSSSFGKVTATSSSPRVLQFNARVMF